MTNRRQIPYYLELLTQTLASKAFDRTAIDLSNQDKLGHLPRWFDPCDIVLTFGRVNVE